MNDTTRAQLAFIGVTAWRNAGFDGRGITVWITELSTGTHGANVTPVFRDTAPGARIVNGSINRTTPNRHEMTNLTVTDEQDNRRLISFDDFLNRYKPDILSSSNGGTQNTEWARVFNETQRIFNFSAFQAAHNQGVELPGGLGNQFPVELALVIGALQWSNGNPSRASWSNFGDVLDFMQLQGGVHQGTSFSTPVQAGMAAMIMQRYGKMSQQELFNYLRFIARPLGPAGEEHDIWYGWGQPILPALRRRYITMTTHSNTYHIDGQPYQMDTRPVNIEGNVFVPVRVISEGLGKQVDWQAISNGVVNVTIRGNGIAVNLTTGSDIMTVNGRKVILNFAPFIDENSRTLVPIRAIAEAFRCQVNWVQREAKVMILEG